MTLHITGDAAADQLLTDDPLALLIGMLLDQQVPMETAFAGDASALWTQGDPDGAEVLRRLKALPGFGEQKAKIFLALLGKQYGFTGSGWREASAPYGAEGTLLSVADIVSPETLARVRENKKAAKAAARGA